jgi:hypothetical protein
MSCFAEMGRESDEDRSSIGQCNGTRDRYNQREYGTDLDYMGIVCLKMEGFSKDCKQRCKPAATSG